MNLIEDLVKGGSPKMNHEEASQKLSAGDTVSFLEEKNRKNGDEYWTEVVVTPIEYEGKQANLSINRDISERMQARKSLEIERERLKKLHNAVDRFQACENENDLYRTTLEVTGDVFAFDICIIYVHREGRLVPVASSEPDVSDLPSYEKDEALAGLSFSKRQTFWGEDIREVGEAKPEGLELRSYMSVPIGDLGVFQAASNEEGAFSEVDIELTEILAGHLNEEIKRIRLEQELKERADRDPLTGLYNRRYFNETLSQEVERSERYGHNIAFLMVDINRFKEVNDRYSHQTGDLVLQEVAILLQDNVRQVDIVVRYGGDEFLIMMPETNGDSMYMAKRLREEIGDWNENSDLLDFPLTLAIGLSHWNPDQGRSVEQALKEADEKMYEEKER